ncbi:DUF4402 domain-containing protein [Vibrio coralliirubri]|uniref:DUF4402 domain-containing protein n=1 Tax=Vibrio coralliirubri TaxID=1516159 RepID=UPI00073F2F2B|nr:DUF4402 domain-containing protein [Vibrio coralliirubri]
MKTINTLTVFFSVFVLITNTHASIDTAERHLKKLQLKQVESFDFGRLIRNGNLKGTITISPSGQVIERNIRALERIKPALFYLCGEPNHKFQLELPTQVNLKSIKASSISIGDFTSNLNNWEGQLPVSGCKNIRIGATIEWYSHKNIGGIESHFPISVHYVDLH